MLTRVLIAGALLLAAVVFAVVAERRRRGRAPLVTVDEQGAPTSVDRSDFPRPDAPWLVVVFSADRCASCAQVRPKVAALASDDVVTFDAEEHTHAHLHARYGVDAAPMTLIVDSQGVVREAFFGNVSATDLWAAVATARGAAEAPREA